MNYENKENIILLTIKYIPSIFIILIAVLITNYISTHHLNNLEKEKNLIKNEYVQSNKEAIKTRLSTVDNYINKKNLKTENTLKKDLKHRINIVHKVATNIYNKNKDTLSKEKIIWHIKNTIEALRFNNGRGYFFIYDLKGTAILQPIRPEKEGKNFFNTVSHGTFITQEFINIAKSKKGEGFKTWMYNKPDSLDKEYKKIGYVKKFEPYNWYIGTGEYVSDFKDEVKKEILEHLKDLKYQKGGHVFVISQKGELLVTKSLLSKVSEINKQNLFVIGFNDFINSKKENTYLEYEYQFNNDEKNHSKIAYLKKVDIYNWVIGTGFNYDSLNETIMIKQKKLEKEYTEHLSIIRLTALVITIIVLILSFFISKLLEKMFHTYNQKLLKKETIKLESMMEELNTILDHSPMMVAYKDTQNNIIRVNKTFANAFNLSIGEYQTVSAKDVFPNDYKKHFEEDLEVIKSKKVKIDIIDNYESKSGLIIVEKTKVPIFNKKGEVENIIVFILDITQRIYLKQELEEKYTMLRKLTEAVPGAIYQFRLYPDGRMTFPYISHGAQDIWELAPDDLLNDAIPGLNRIYPDDVEMMATSIENSAKTMEIWNLEYRHNLPKKGLRWLQGQAKPEKLEDGSILWHGYVNDITEEKEKEQLLTQQSKMETMGEMIGNIAHQWKQPLSLISMSSGLLKLNQEDNTFSSEEDINGAIVNIDNSVQYLSTTIDDFRNFFIPDKQKVYFQLKTVYEKTYRLINSQFRNNNIQIIVELEDIEILGYPNELLQVLINIIKNARDELIKNNTDNKKLIFINGYKENEKIILKIKDNAGGIPKDIINEIFNAYFTTKKESEGTGIGLYMSKQIIENMNGIIKVSNTNYKYEDIEYLGAEFVIELQQ